MTLPKAFEHLNYLRFLVWFKIPFLFKLSKQLALVEESRCRRFYIFDYKTYIQNVTKLKVLVGFCAALKRMFFSFFFVILVI
jgi:hypothetical protein